MIGPSSLRALTLQSKFGRPVSPRAALKFEVDKVSFVRVAAAVFQTAQAHCGVAPSQCYATEPGGAHSAQGHCGVAPSRWFATEPGSAHSAQGHCGVAPSHDVVQVVREQMGKVADVALAAVHCGGGAGAWRLALARMKVGGQDRDMDKASFE